MAKRPIFVPNKRQLGIEIVDVDFRWHSGMAPSQKKKSILELHSKAHILGIKNVLEISSKSEDDVGVKLSAFNLKTKSQNKGIEFSVESAFQSSKIFENGGPYLDLLTVDSRSAKKDPRIKNSGRLVGFQFFGEKFPVIPHTFFYDWLYINILIKNPELVDRMLCFDGFSDIEFNPEKSINCQARAAAIFSTLLLHNKIKIEPINSTDYFSITKDMYIIIEQYISAKYKLY